MNKTKIKKWGVRIILSSLLAIFLVVHAPIQTSNVAYAETSEEREVGLNEICNTLFKKPCRDVNQQEFESNHTALGVEIGQTLDQWKASVSQSSVDEKIAAQSKKSLEFLVGMQKVLNRLLWPILMMTGGLMDNSLLFGSGMEARLREIWIPIRNIVNIMFVIVLVGIALYNVLGIGDENGTYSIKAILPKLIVGIIVVNFSFMGIKVFLDAINVLTVSIFAIPSQIDEGLGKILASPNSDQAASIKRMCRAMKDKNGGEKITQEELQKGDELIVAQVVAQKYQYRFQTDFEGHTITAADTTAQINTKVETALANNPGALNQYKEDLKIKKDGRMCDGDSLTPLGVAFLNRWDSRNAALAMALNMGKIVFYEDVDISSVKVDKLVINAVFSVMMWLIYAASFIALFVVLLARLVVMWLAIALSPVLMLMIAVPAIKEKISGFGEISDKFVQNAIAPLGIALSMTVGWVMLRALQNVNSISGGNAQYLDFTNGFPVVGLSTIQDLIVALGTVAVVWLGVFSAASSSIASPVTDWMKNGLQKAGSWIGTLPLKHAPLFPIEISGHKENYTGEQLLTALSDLGDSSRNRDKLSNLIRGGTSTAPKVLADKTKIDTAEKAAGVINTNKSKFNKGDADSVASLAQFKRNYPRIWRKMQNSSEGRELDIAMNNYQEGDKDTETALGKAAVKWAQRAHPSAEYKGEEIDNKPNTNKKAEEVDPPTKETKYGGYTLTEHGGDEKVGERIAKNMEEAADAVREGLENGKMKTEAQVATALNVPKVRPTNAGELESLLGSVAYAKLKTLLGTTPPEKFIKERLAKNDKEKAVATTQPAATNPTNPAGTPTAQNTITPPIQPGSSPSEIAGADQNNPNAPEEPPQNPPTEQV